MLLTLLLALLAAPAFPQDWPQFRRDPALTGTASAPLPEELEVRWQAPLGFSVESSPAIAAGAVYLSALPDVVVRLDLATGEERWRFQPAPDSEADSGYPDDLFGESSPTVAGGLVFLGDLLGVFRALDAETGELRWSFPTGAEIKASPVVAGDLVLIGSYDHHFYGLDRRTGELRFSAPTEGPVHATAAIAGGVAYIGGCDAIVRGIRLASGAEVFRFDSGAYTAASPAIADGAAFFGTFNNEVLAVDLASARRRWTYMHPDRHFPFYASAAVAGELVLVAGRDKLLHALDRATGEARWTFRARARFDSSPAVAGGRVYAGNADGRLHVLDLATGEPLAEHHLGAAIMGSPAIADDFLVVGTQEGAAFGLSAPAR